MMTNIFLSFLGISVSISLVVAALMLLTPFLNKRYAAKWKYLIWIFIALRLLIPFSGTDRQPVIDKLSQVKNQVKNQIKTQDAPEAENGYADALPDEAAPRRVIVEIPAQMTTPIAMQPEKSDVSITLLDIAAFIWMLGSLIVISVHLFSYLHYKGQLMKNGSIIRDARILRLMSGLKRELHIKCIVRVVEYPEAASPMIIGFLKPVLVLPEECYSEEELYFILKHELVHLKRGDVYFKLLFAAAGALHWFNPLIWLMQKEAAVDMELSCDERVTQGADYELRKAYTETLLSMLHRRCTRITVLSTQFYGGKNIMKKRFKNILIKTAKKNGAYILVCAVVLTVSLGTLIGCSIKEADSDKLMEESRGDNIDVPGDERLSGDLKNQPENIETLATAKGGGADYAAMTATVDNAETETPMTPTAITIMREGEADEISATLYVGEGYSIYLTDGNWQQYAPDAWLGTVDGQAVLDGKVQLVVTHFEDKDESQVKEELADGGYVEMQNHDMRNEAGELIRNVRLYEFENDVWGVFYSYPVEAEEGWGAVLSVMADTFAVSTQMGEEQSQAGGSGDTGMSIEAADIQEIRSIIEEFAAAYFGGNVDGLHKFLTNPYEWNIDAYAGTGTVSDFKLKGLPDIGERNVKNKWEISLEFMDSNDDSYSYLTFSFVKQEDGWKINSYGVEK